MMTEKNPRDKSPHAINADTAIDRSDFSTQFFPVQIRMPTIFADYNTSLCRAGQRDLLVLIQQTIIIALICRSRAAMTLPK
jgi:hypothetical protein